jgi:HAE1 family hydrophobic/amphiphilic exporter-1
MTAFATIFALIPLSLGISGGGIIIAEELGTVVIGGLLASTLLTLVVIPVVYSLFDDLGRLLGLSRT